MSGSLIVFDLDGTLVDSRRDLADSTNDVLASYGAARLPVDDVARMVGDGAKMLVARALKAAGAHADLHEALDRFRETYDRRLLDYTRPYAGVVELVRALETRAAMAVLTNKPLAPTERLLDAFGLRDAFRDIVGGDMAFARKPDPEGLRHLMTNAGAEGAATLMVGDSMIDIDTARAAGARACLARYGFGHLRGPVTLAADEPAVDDVPALAAEIDRFLSVQGRTR